MKHSKIKQAALELFRHYSYVKTSVADIATAAGIGKGTIYLSFKTKEDILFSLVDDEIALTKRRDDPIHRNPEVAFEDKLRLFSQSLLDMHFSIRDLMFGSFENVEGSDLKDVYLKFAKYIDQVSAFWMEVLALHGYPASPERLASIREFILFLSGRIVTYILSHDWNCRAELSLVITRWSHQLFQALVVQPQPLPEAL